MKKIDRWLVGLALLAVAVHVATQGGYNYFRDELYYIACGRHLAWGYVDHPPLIAVAARASEVLFGPSLRGLRIWAALCAGLTTLLAGLMARDLGGGRFAQLLAAFAALAAPLYLFGFTTLTMNVFEIVWWSLLCWLVIRLLQGADERLWLLVGVVVGIGFLTKISILFIVAGIGVGFAIERNLRPLRSKWLWIGAAVAAAIGLPHVLWQVHNGWPTLEFMENARRLKNAQLSTVAFFLAQVLLLQPVAAVLWLGGLLSLFAVPRFRQYRSFGWAYLFMFALFVATNGKVYYLMGIYPLLFAIGGVAFETWTARAKRTRAAYVALLAITSAVLAPALMPILPPAAMERYSKALHVSEPAMERHRPARLPQVYADMFGWEEMVARIASAYHALSPEEQARCAIYAHNYGEAAAIDFYGPKYGLPRAASGHNNYFLWGPPPANRGALVITVGESREDVGKTYNQVTEVGRTHSDFAMPYEDDRPIYLGRDPKNSLSEIWWRCKDYI